MYIICMFWISTGYSKFSLPALEYLVLALRTDLVIISFLEQGLCGRIFQFLAKHLFTTFSLETKFEILEGYMLPIIKSTLSFRYFCS